MSGDQLNATFTRRRWLSLATAFVGAACTGELSVTTHPAATGKLRGMVVDQTGAPSVVGRIYLLAKSGLNSGTYADVDAHGAFDFGDVPVGDYQLRYWGGQLASVPEPLPNPLRVTVAASATASVTFVVALGTAETDGVEIYAGDNFYQLQPFGPVGGTVTVPLGTLVCWYNVGTTAHTVTGGPWRDSGVLQEAANFMWTADTVGTFPSQCRFHGPGMQGMLVVVV